MATVAPARDGRLQRRPVGPEAQDVDGAEGEDEGQAAGQPAAHPQMEGGTHGDHHAGEQGHPDGVLGAQGQEGSSCPVAARRRATAAETTRRAAR